MPTRDPQRKNGLIMNPMKVQKRLMILDVVKDKRELPKAFA